MSITDIELVPVDPRVEPFMTVKRYSEVMKVSLSTSHRQVRAGQIPGVIDGSHPTRINTLAWLRALGYHV